LKRELNRLTTLGVKALQNKPAKLYPDGANLFARVDKGGTVGYMIRFVSPVHKRTRDGGLGAAAECSTAPGAITLKEARAIRDEWRKQVGAGIDPIDARQAAKATTIAEGQKAKTFGEAAQSWLEVADLELKRDKTKVVRRRAIEQHLKPIWNTPVSSLTPAMVVNVLKPLAATRANTAHRLRGYVRAILDYADKLGTPTNSAKFSGTYFRGLLPAKERVQPTIHYAALPLDDVPAFVQKLRQQPGAAPKALLFAILCALRSNEAIGLKWSYVDFVNKVATFPAEVMKTGVEFRCALSQQAINLLTSLPRLKDCPYAFPGRWGGRLSERMLFSTVSRMGYDCTVHGFRSCFRDYIGERTDFDTVAAEHSLAHQVGNSVMRAYARGDNLQKRFALMQSWADFIDPLTAPDVMDVVDNVIPLPLKASA
jgi:integrase